MRFFRKIKTKLYNYKKQPEQIIKDELINITRNAPFLYIGEMAAEQQFNTTQLRILIQGEVENITDPVILENLYRIVHALEGSFIP